MPKKHDNEDIVFEEETEEGGGFKGKSEKKLRSELKQAQQEKQEYLDGWQRARADLINFKKEAEEGKKSFAKFAQEDLLHQLLPILDSFEAALAHLSADKAGGDSGVEQIYKQFLSTLKQNGVEQVNPAGEKFDPAQHESVGSVQVENKNQDDTIVEVVQKGYTLHNKIIRPAKVQVGEYE